ncbi:hypothetical protein HYALB_00011725 [Hymenoscyphus albidus]|uniref:Pyrroloquinoline quinone-dependent pyranose dehydrogenase beta-propeller domain-containing protein n=1 Tax=Hymenoscyphus albidus TaxID=595503 RepID=A0A9N9LQN7_9HELO|nr:hypothetical protein HYALB_00011725 [Hymenoscyphus albidus]
MPTLSSLFTSIAVVALLFQPGVLAKKTPKRACTALGAKYPAIYAGGLSATVIINGLKSPRGLVFDTAGNLLVVEQGGGGVRQIKLTDDGTTVCVASSKQIINDATLNHGIDLSADGKLLFVSSVSTVFQYNYDPVTGATGKKTIITGMQQSGHVTRTLLVSKKIPELLLVARGSSGNVDAGAKDKTTGRSQIRYFNITLANQAAIPQATGGKLLGWGLRNPVGIAENPVTGDIWSIDQGEDDIRRNGNDVHINNPGEKLNFHGKLDDPANTLLGANYGYPECVPAYEPSSIGITGLKVGEMFWVEGTSQTAAQDATCKSRIAPRLVFPAHNSPIDIKFRKNASAAYLSWHGSWDRNPPDGYRLDRVDFVNGDPKELSTSTAGGVHVMSNPNGASCPNSCFRPAGLAWDSKDRLFMSSDTTGEIFIFKGA